MNSFPYSRMLLPLLAVLIAFPARSQESPAGANEGVRNETEPRRVNGIAAKVNGEVITLNELMIKVAPLQSVLMTRYPRRGPAYQTQLRQLRSTILDELIDRTIIFSEFKDRINAIPEHRIEAEVKRIVNDVYKGDEELFRAYLKETNLTRDQFKQQQRREILVQIVKSQHFGDVPNPTEEELREEYEQWKITNRDRSQDIATYQRIYLLKNARGGPEAQLLLAERLVEKIKNGGDFPSLAKLYSNDTHADEGGLWKEVARNDLSMEFGTILFETEGTEVIGPVEDTRGYNILKVVKRDLGPAKPFEEAREQLTRQVISQKKKGNFEKWMKKMRSRADIQKKL